MQYLFYILLISFLYFNYKIIISDIRHKIIPNKYLGYLLLLIPFWWMILLNNPAPSPLPLGISEGGIDVLLFIGQVILTFIISFILYSFGIWSAGDAKYLLVLSLFIPYIGVIPFIGNIGLLTIAYLLIYFIWFYFGKCLFYKGYAKSLWGNIKNDLNDKWLGYKSNKGGKTFFIILKWVVIFLIIFVSIRLARIYLFNEIFTGETSQIELISGIVKTYSFYLIFGLIILFIGGLYIFRLLINKIKNIISGKLGVNITIIGNILIIFLFIGLIYYIYIQYLTNSNEIINSLFKIFTLYLAIYIFARIVIYSYKITFGIAECEYIDIKDLKEGDIVDKEFLRKIFGNQLSLGFATNKKEKQERKNYLLFPNPNIFFKQMPTVITNKELKILQKCYIIVNKYHIKNKTIGYQKTSKIKILKTFSFGGYLFGGFLITIVFSNEIINFLIKIIKKIILINS